LGELAFFTHEPPGFFLVSIYAFFYFGYVYKKRGHFFVLFLLNLLLILSKDIGMVLLPFTFLALIKPKKISLSVPVLPTICLSTLTLPSFTKPDFFGKIVYDINAVFFEGFQSFHIFHPGGALKYFQQPIFFLSFLSFFVKKDLHLLVLSILTFVYFYAIITNPIFNDSVFRYSLSLLPLHLFYAKDLIK
jgi:hypothetical protein